MKARLLPGINHRYNRYEDLKKRERAGKKTRLPAQVAKVALGESRRSAGAAAR